MCEQDEKEGTDSVIPIDHPIRDYWERTKLLHSIEGTIELARKGDRYAARRLLAIYAHQVKRYTDTLKPGSIYAPEPPDPLLLDYLKECLMLTFDDLSADIALNLRKGAGKGRDTLNFDSIRKKVDLAFEIACLHDNNMTVDEACNQVAIARGVSVSAASKAYGKYMKIK